MRSSRTIYFILVWMLKCDWLALQPNVTAPGLITAWSPAASKKDYNILSGTSMAAPHITGIAALIKSVHPLWSPSAIKSALMTTGKIYHPRKPSFTHKSYLISHSD